MADLVTHLCTALLPASLAPRRWMLPLSVGVVLPDALGRAVPLGLELVRSFGVPLSDRLIWPWTALHAPLGITLVAALVALCFVPRDRRTVLLGLWAGGALHIGLDVLQDHHGHGYALLAPLSWRTFELGWIGSESTVPWALPLLAVTALAWGARLLRSRVTTDRYGGLTDQANDLRPPCE